MRIDEYHGLGTGTVLEESEGDVRLVGIPAAAACGVEAVVAGLVEVGKIRGWVRGGSGDRVVGDRRRRTTFLVGDRRRRWGRVCRCSR